MGVAAPYSIDWHPLRESSKVGAMNAPWNEPFDRFTQVFARAKAAQPKDPNAVVLATVNTNGFPAARVVLLKSYDERGFVIYTNRESAKGQAMVRTRAAALCFYWAALDEQVRVEGRTEGVAAEEADAYFATRPRASQIGAWASLQSTRLSDRETLASRVQAFEEKFEGKPVPRPSHWGGFRIVPSIFEFWKARESRLHDRERYEARVDSWEKGLLYP